MEYGLLLALITLSILLSALSLRFSLLQKKRIDKIFSSKGDVDIEALLIEYAQEQKLAVDKVEKIHRSHDQLIKQIGVALQKTGLVRFNPFSDTGGDQSFAFALLDANDNGIIITAIHGREGTRIYTKPVEFGKCSYSLSSEEVAALSTAIKSGRKT